jgi:hypothetical protein
MSEHMISGELLIAMVMFGIAMSVIIFGFRDRSFEKDNSVMQHNNVDHRDPSIVSIIQSTPAEQSDTRCPICGHQWHSDRPS